MISSRVQFKKKKKYNCNISFVLSHLQFTRPCSFLLLVSSNFIPKELSPFHLFHQFNFNDHKKSYICLSKRRIPRCLNAISNKDVDMQKMIKRKKKRSAVSSPGCIELVILFFQEQFRFAETALTFRPRNKEKNLDREQQQPKRSRCWSKTDD